MRWPHATRYFPDPTINPASLRSARLCPARAMAGADPHGSRVAVASVSIAPSPSPQGHGSGPQVVHGPDNPPDAGHGL